MPSRPCAGPASSAIPTPAREDLLVAARALAAATVDDLAQARAREGARLGELIEQRCAGLTTLVAQVRARLPEVRTTHPRPAG